jgi:RimJ/RimL family protein N-acetyltransferase
LSLSDGVVALRPWRNADAPELVSSLDGEDGVARYIELIPQPYTEEHAASFLADAARRWADGSANLFAVEDAATGGLVGSIGVRWNDARDLGEIGYWLRAEARGRGLTTRALVLMSRWALSLPGVGRVQLRAEPENVASCRVAEKAGFRREAVLRAALWHERLQRHVDHAMYSLLPRDLT